MMFSIPDVLRRAIPAFRLIAENPSLVRADDLVGGASATKAGEPRFAGTLRFASTFNARMGQESDNSNAALLRQRLIDLFMNVLDDPSNHTRLPLFSEFVPTFDAADISGGIAIADIAYNATDGAFRVGLSGSGIPADGLPQGIYVKGTFNSVPRIMQVVKFVGGKHVFWPSLNMATGTAITPADSIDAIIRTSRSSTSGTITEYEINRISDAQRFDWIEKVK